MIGFCIYVLRIASLHNFQVFFFLFMFGFKNNNSSTWFSYSYRNIITADEVIIKFHMYPIISRI